MCQPKGGCIHCHSPLKYWVSQKQCLISEFEFEFTSNPLFAYISHSVSVEVTNFLLDPTIEIIVNNSNEKKIFLIFSITKTPQRYKENSRNSVEHKFCTQRVCV